MMLPRLTPAEFDRIDNALLAVLEEPDRYGPALWDFACTEADRIERYGLDTVWSDEYWEMVRSIEAIAAVPRVG